MHSKLDVAKWLCHTVNKGTEFCTYVLHRQLSQPFTFGRCQDVNFVTLQDE